MVQKKKSWREKLLNPQESKIVDIPPKMQKRLGTGKMLIPKPLEMDALIRKVPKGKLITHSQIRTRLAQDYKVDTTCPLVTGIFVHIISEAAFEDLHAGKTDYTPYWRVIKDDGSLNPKFPGSFEIQASFLTQEGHTIEAAVRNKPPKVMDFNNKLIKI